MIDWLFRHNGADALVAGAGVLTVVWGVRKLLQRLEHRRWMAWIRRWYY